MSIDLKKTFYLFDILEYQAANNVTDKSTLNKTIPNLESPRLNELSSYPILFQSGFVVKYIQTIYSYHKDI